jgi:hypothetical protein
MDEIRISNDATYSPVALTDVMLAAPLVSRVLLGATLPGRMVQMVALGVYATSAVDDWLARRGIRKIDFLVEFGADVKHLREMPRALREREVSTLAARINDQYTATRIPRDQLAREVDFHLTEFIASVTGQRVVTSTEVRNFGLAKVLFPFALGACDILSGDISIFRDTGVFEPHVLAHELSHRKGYHKELEAQALAYFSLTRSENPVLVQSALCERLHRHIRVLAEDDERRFIELVDAANLRLEIREDLLQLRPSTGRLTGAVASAMKALYDERMRLTGQNGISDYDRGFTNFLYTFENGTEGRPAPARLAPAPT